QEVTKAMGLRMETTNRSSYPEIRWTFEHPDVGTVRATGFSSEQSLAKHVLKHFLSSNEAWEDIALEEYPPARFRMAAEGQGCSLAALAHPSLCSNPESCVPVVNSAGSVYARAVRDGTIEMSGILICGRVRRPAPKDARRLVPCIVLASRHGIYVVLHETIPNGQASHLLTAFRPDTVCGRRDRQAFCRRAANKVAAELAKYGA
ncbi:MAG: hypothetical protein ABIK09_19080, partial [Pseudomonadota bacterium]